jgi:ketosteroid isomerase-like protein
MSLDLCTRYLAAMNRSDLEGVLALFTSDAIVHSPLYGPQSANKFFSGLFADTQRSVTTLRRVFASADDSAAVALQFHYAWTMASGKMFEFEVVDVFELAPDHARFRQLTIIYDTAFLRSEFTSLQPATAD